MASIFDEDAPVEVVPTAPLVTGASPAPAAAAPAPTAVVPSARSADIFAGDAPRPRAAGRSRQYRGARPRRAQLSLRRGQSGAVSADEPKFCLRRRGFTR